MVTKGCNQVEGIDYTYTFAPIARLSTVRLLLAMAASKKWHMHHLDVNNVFLHAFNEEEIYMQPLDGYKPIPSSHVCKLICLL